MTNKVHDSVHLMNIKQQFKTTILRVMLTIEFDEVRNLINVISPKYIVIMNN